MKKSRNRSGATIAPGNHECKGISPALAKPKVNRAKRVNWVT